MTTSLLNNNKRKLKIRLWTRKRRGGELEEQLKPMNDSLSEILSRRWRTRDKTNLYVFQFSANDLRHMMSRLCQRAGGKPFGFHAIRYHVFSVTNDSGKASMKQVQKLAGYRRQSTTELYLHSISQSVRDAVGGVGLEKCLKKKWPPSGPLPSEKPLKKGVRQYAITP